MPHNSVLPPLRCDNGLWARQPATQARPHALHRPRSGRYFARWTAPVRTPHRLSDRRLPRDYWRPSSRLVAISFVTYLLPQGAETCLLLSNGRIGQFSVGPPPSVQSAFHNGSSTVNTVPCPSSLSTAIVPLWFSTIALTIASPMPAPPSTRDRAGSAR